jgi:hypothetical protein
MTAIVEKKKKIFGNIAASKTLFDGLPKLKTSSSFPSINNGGNSITFLTDLIKSLIGFAALIVAIVDILTYSLSEIELEIKKALKSQLKDIVSCGVDPTLPNFIKSTGSGINIEVNKVDFLDLLKIDPNSVGGKLSYGDSTDFNRFLYDTIQQDGNINTWNNIMDVTFNSVGNNTRPNNSFTIKANSSYDNKTLTDLNNDFVDSLTLFNSEGIINRIIDGIYGSISITVKKTTKQLELEAKINDVIDNLVNSDNQIDDSYFTFTNEEIYKQELNADLRKKGITKLECCNKIASSIPVSFLNDLNNEISTAANSSEKKEIITNNLNKMANQTTINSKNSSDNSTIKLDFIQGLINNLIKSIINVILSPKIIMIFIINYKIIYGQTAIFSDPIDFIKKNKNLFHNIMKKISGMIITILLGIALKKISELVACNVAKKQVEKGKTQLSQLLSLVGIPQESLRIIKGLT